LGVHSINRGNGIVTPGVKKADLLRAEAEAIFRPLNLVGKSVLDIGAWNGYFSFEARRRDAARLLATDHYPRRRKWECPQGAPWPTSVVI
jgi:tRNA (mo5U34)-methyltransferase